MEQKGVNTVSLSVIALLGLAPVTLAQRGMGDSTGVVRQGLTPEIVTLQGKAVRVVTGPCKNTTGGSDIGTHFFLELSPGQQRNIHLGPAHLVQSVTDRLVDEETVWVRAFRTDKMPQGHYNAVTIKVGNETLRLRHQNLRPLWAGSLNSHRTANVRVNIPTQVPPPQNVSAGPKWGRGHAPMRMGWGRGRGRCRGWHHRGSSRPRCGVQRGGRW